LCWLTQHVIAQQSLLSLNIRYDNPSDGVNAWSYRKEIMANWIADSIQPDVICLQEVLSTQLSYLQSHWSNQYDYYGVGREDGIAQGEFAPIFFKKDRYQLIQAKTLWLSPNPDRPSKGWDAACERILSAVWLWDVKMKDTVCIFNTHWDHIGKLARENSAKMLLSEFEKIPSHVAFYCAGDFNASFKTPEIQKLSYSWRNIITDQDLLTPTFNGFKNDVSEFQHIDFIWTRQSNLQSYRFYQKRSLPHLPFISDHDAIWIVETD
jgi:endonuclease/exonuclease/phosphatase family metal-dependent hydrolase